MGFGQYRRGDPQRGVPEAIQDGAPFLEADTAGGSRPEYETQGAVDLEAEETRDDPSSCIIGEKPVRRNGAGKEDGLCLARAEACERHPVRRLSGG